MSMKNETAIVTGSTSGIGRKLAELFLREGCKVAICSRNENNVKETLVELKEKFGDSVIGFPCDVSNPDDLNQFVEKVTAEFGSIRILVANAGVNLTYGPFEYMTLEKVSSDTPKVVGINLIGTIYTIAAVMQQMIKQGYGRIVTLSGGGADRPVEHMTIYSASKGGVNSFSKCLALELEKKGYDIKINLFNPGMIKTNLYTALPVEGWKDRETQKHESELALKYVGTDIEESCSKVIPYVLPTCKKNGQSFRGFS
ncbi:MAG: SDR family oxidoreductase, partial [Candidatus Lokiarchaeota archaeon]|nr:SDR family oxidoreductase [Candidatus Lokiarchaeota archaeon]